VNLGVLIGAGRLFAMVIVLVIVVREGRRLDRTRPVAIPQRTPPGRPPPATDCEQGAATRAASVALEVFLAAQWGRAQAFDFYWRSLPEAEPADRKARFLLGFFQFSQFGLLAGLLAPGGLRPGSAWRSHRRSAATNLISY